MTIHVENTVPALMDFTMQAYFDGQMSHALEAIDAVFALNPNHAEAHHMASHAYNKMGETQQSALMLTRAIELAPNNPQYHYNAAVNAMGDMASTSEADQARAMVHYAQALRLSPDMPDALWNYGECLRMNEHFHAALTCFERLIELKQTDYDALPHRMAVCYSSVGQLQKAETCFKKALAQPNCDMLSHWEYALFLLKQERFAEGFALYNDRFKCGGRNSVFCHDFDYPLWSGTFTENQTVLVHGEQGLGDELMFASMFNELLDDAEKSNATVVLACKPALARLFAYNFPRAQIRAHKVGALVADVSDLSVDAQLPMGHLMPLYRQNRADFDAHRGAYFAASPESMTHYAERLAVLGREAVNGKRRLRVGLMWGSNPAAVSARFTRWTGQRSVPLNLFAPLAEFIDDVEFVSLQNHERGAEAAFAPELDIVDFSLDQADFYDTAGLMENLDLVITVCTSVSHLAGGMAKDTLLLLMSRADWRHGTDNATSFWYNGTNFLQQTEPNQWAVVMQRVADELRTRVNEWKKTA